MTALRVVGLMITFGCFNAWLGTTSKAQNEKVSSLTSRRLKVWYSLWDVNGDGIVEMEEHSAITDCIGEKLNLDEKNEKRVYAGFTKAWKSFGFDKVERGNAFHLNTILDTFARNKHSQCFKDGARRAFTFLFDSLRRYSDSFTIRIDQLRVFHCCIGVDPKITRIAFDKIDVDKDGGISEDELCDAGVDFMTGEDKDGEGSLFFGYIP